MDFRWGLRWWIGTGIKLPERPMDFTFRHERTPIFLPSGMPCPEPASA